MVRKNRDDNFGLFTLTDAAVSVTAAVKKGKIATVVLGFLYGKLAGNEEPQERATTAQ